MTAHSQRRPLRPHQRPQRAGRVALGLLTLFCLLLFLRNGTLAAHSLSQGLTLCAKTLIPSLFPFLVISELLIRSDLLRPLGRLAARSLRPLLRIGEEGACALLMGMLCGFPIGTKSAVELEKQGKLGEGELSHLLTFCNVPAPAFLVGSVGGALLGDTRLGVALLVVTLLSALTVGALGARLWGCPPSAPPSTASPPSEEPSAIRVITEAIGSSATAMLRICAFVVFFSALTGALEGALGSASLSREGGALLFGALELTGGMARSAACSPSVAPYLCAFLAGFSGLSVHLQIISLCDGLPFPFGRFFLSKLARGVLNVLLMGIYLAIT